MTAQLAILLVLVTAVIPHGMQDPVAVRVLLAQTAVLLYLLLLSL